MKLKKYLSAIIGSLLLTLGVVTFTGSIGSKVVNAAEATITFGTNNVNINAESVTEKDVLGNSWTITTVGTTSFTPQPTYSQVGSSKKPATSITFTATLPKDYTISSIEAKFGGNTGTAGTISLKVGDTEVGSGSLNATSDVTVNSTSHAVGNVITISVTNISKGVKVYYIKYICNEIGEEHTHKPQLVERQDPTCVDDGHIAYYTCAGEPGTYYKDETCTETYSSEEIIIKSTGEHLFVDSVCTGCGLLNVPSSTASYENLNFAEIKGFDSWSNKYLEHVITYTDLCTVTFTGASKQTTNITDIPVTKGSDITVVMNEGNYISSIDAFFKQWTTKEQTITLQISTDGGTNYTAPDPKVSSDTFRIKHSLSTKRVNAIKFSFSSKDDQIGTQLFRLGHYSDDSTSNAAYAQGALTYTEQYKGVLRVLGIAKSGEFDDYGIRITNNDNPSQVVSFSSADGLNAYDRITAYTTIDGETEERRSFTAGAINAEYESGVIFGVEIYNIPEEIYSFTIVSWVKLGDLVFESDPKVVTVLVTAESGTEVE